MIDAHELGNIDIIRRLVKGATDYVNTSNSSNFAGIGTSGTNVTMTLNSAGLALSVSPPGAAAEANWVTLDGNVLSNSSASGSTIKWSAGNNITLAATDGSIVQIIGAAGDTANAMHTSERANYFYTSNNTFLTTAALSNHTHDYQSTGNYLTTAALSNHTHSDLYIPLGNSTDYATSVLSNTFQTTGAYLTTAMQSVCTSVFQYSSNTSAITASALNTSQSSLFQHTSATSNITASVMNTSERASLQYTSANTKFVQGWELEGVQTAGTTSSSQGTQLYLSGGNMLTISGNSNTIIFSVNTASILGTGAAASFVYTSQSSLFQHTSATSAITADAVNTSLSSKFVQGYELEGNNTAGTTSMSISSQLYLSGGNNITLSGNSNTIVISAGAGGGGIAASVGGNSTSGGAGYSNITSGTMHLRGGNNITLSQDGASVTISGANIGGAQTAISGVGVSNTTYTSGTIIFSNQSNVTIGSSVDGVSQYVRLSVADAIPLGNSTAYATSILDDTFLATGYTTHTHDYQSTNAGYLTTQSNQAFSASGSSSTFQTIQFGNTNGVSFSISGGSVVGTVKTDYQTSNANYLTSQSVQTQGMVSLNGSTGQISIATGSSMSSSLNGSSITFGLASNISTAWSGQTTANQSRVLDFNGSSGQISFVTGSGMSTTTNASTLTFGLRSDISTAWSGQTTANASRVIQINGSSGTLSFATASSLSSSSNGSTIWFGLASNITTALMDVGSSTRFVGINTSSSSTGGSDLKFSLNSSGATFSVPAWLTSAYSATSQFSASFLNTGEQHIRQIQASNTTYTSGTVEISASRNASVSYNASTISVYGPASVLYALSVGGNTGTTGSSNVSNSGFVIAGGSNVTLSQSNNSISIHALSQSAEPRVVSINGTSGSLTFNAGTFMSLSQDGVSFTHYVTNTSAITSNAFPSANTTKFAGTGTTGANVTMTLDSNGLNLSVAAPGAAAENNWVHIQGNTASNSTASGSTIMWSAGDNITLAATNGSIIQIKAAAGGAGVAIANSETTYTSGTVQFRGTNVTISSSAGQYMDISGPAVGNVYFNNSNGITFGTSTNGVSTTVTASANTGNVYYVDSNGLFFGSSTQGVSTTITMSHNNAYELEGNNTAGTTSLSLGSKIYLSGGNNITLSGNSNTIVVSAGAGGGGVAIAGSGASTVTSGTLQFSNANGLSFGLNGSTMTASLNNAGTSLSTVGTNGSVLLGAINTAGISLSVPAWITTAAAGGVALQGSGTYTQNTGTVQFSNSNNVTFGLTAGTMTGSIPAFIGTGTSTQTTTATNLAVSGNTAGITITYPAVGYLSFVNSNGYTWSTSVNGISSAIWLVLA